MGQGLRGPGGSPRDWIPGLPILPRDPLLHALYGLPVIVEKAHTIAMLTFRLGLYHMFHVGTYLGALQGQDNV